MKKIALLLITFISYSISAQIINEKWIKDNYTKKEYTITMRDGVKLFTAVYVPKDASTHFDRLSGVSSAQVAIIL